MRILVDTLLEGHYHDPQQVTDYLQLISKENTRLTRLIENFLTFSRMERNKQAFQIERIDPSAVVQDAIEAAKTKLSQGRCRFITNLQSPIAPMMADHDAVVMILVNLLDNAYKYTQEEKVIQLSLYEEPDWICFSVKDNGIGLSRRATRRIFNKFYQIDQSLSRQTEGCGLGLSIIQFIVNAHQGSIDVQSRVGQGSTFTVKIPKAPSHNTQRRSHGDDCHC
jgi:signal transduction histidine kinase